jgi:ferritin-like metal-binding protein YciE
MASLQSLQDLYLDQVRDLYSAEHQIIEALPKMIAAASHPELEQAFETHLTQTREQVRRIEQICEGLGESPRGETCDGMKGLLKEGEKVMKARADSDVLDAALIASAQRVEHYEIAGYGCAKTYARLLGRQQDVQLLQQTENEEGDTDKLLTALAEQTINVDALARG